MLDMAQTIIAKSDQLNADDLIGGPITIKVRKLALSATEQPVSVSYEGDNDKPFMPCKSMRRVMVHLWGTDGNQYVGRSMTLYRDEKVIFGGAAVGGIRISHMSHIDAPVTMSLTASKKSKKPFTVQPLVTGGQSKSAKAEPTQEQKKDAAKKKAVAIIAQINASESDSILKDILKTNEDAIKRIENGYSELHELIAKAVDAKKGSFDSKEERHDEELPI